MKITMELNDDFNFEEVLLLAKTSLETRIITYERHNALVGTDITFNNMQIVETKKKLEVLNNLKYEVSFSR